MAILVGNQNAVVDVATAAAHEIVPAVPGRRIKVKSIFLTSTGINTLTWRSGTTPLTGPMAVAANSILPPDQVELITAKGEALVLLLGAAAQVSGHITYELI